MLPQSLVSGRKRVFLKRCATLGTEDRRVRLSPSVATIDRRNAFKLTMLLSPPIPPHPGTNALPGNEGLAEIANRPLPRGDFEYEIS
jgi:hypothetical protein